jgi:hypothetical protein
VSDCAATAEVPRKTQVTDAAIALLQEEHQVEANYRICRSKAASYGYKYDYLHYVWMLKNSAYLQAAERIYEQLPDSRRKEIANGWKKSAGALVSGMNRNDDSQNGRHCVQYFSQLTDTQADLADEKQLLTSSLGEHEEARILQRNIDMEVGCMKRGFNADVVQFEAMKRSCSCMMSLMRRKMSDAEVDHYLALVAGESLEEAQTFIRERLGDPEMQACAM